MIKILTSKKTDTQTKSPDTLSVIFYNRFTPISYGICGEGYEGDLLRSVAKLWDFKIKFYAESHYEGLWLLPSKKDVSADISMGGMSPAIYRIKQGALFSIGTTSFNQSLLVQKIDYESRKIISYQSFKKNRLKIGVIPGTTGEQYALLRGKENQLSPNTFVHYPSEFELLSALMSGEINAIARGEIGNRYQELQNDQLITIASRNYGEHFAFAINNANPELAHLLNQSIRQITNNGKITYLQWLHNPDIFLQRVDKIKSSL